MCRPGKKFEQEVMAAASLMGHQIERRPQPSADEGIDMITRVSNIPFGWCRYAIQCKDNPNGVVGREVVDQLLGVIERENIPMGMVFTTGSFSKKAIKGANDSGRIQLINGNEWRDIKRRFTELLHMSFASNPKEGSAKVKNGMMLR